MRISQKTGMKYIFFVMAMLFTFCFSMQVRAEESGAPYLMGTTDHIELSPQGKVATMTVYAKNTTDTQVNIAVDRPDVCTVAAEYIKEYGTIHLTFTRGEALGEANVTIALASNAAASCQVKVNNYDVAQTFYYEGDGTQNIFGLNIPKFPYKVTVTHDDPNGYFGVLYTEGSGETKVLFNEQGAYSGTAILEKGANATSLQVLASGHWTITISPIVYSSTNRFTGVGDKVSDRFKGDDAKHNIVCANYAAGGHYSVWLVDITNNKKTLLANGAGTYSKTKLNVFLDKWKTYVIAVKSDGNWSVDMGDNSEITVLQ